MPPTVTSLAAPTWREHYGNLKWRQGEHILIAAPTGAGKTTLAAQLIEKRSHAVVFVTKMKDPTFAAEFKGWTRIEEWPKGGPKPYQRRLLLWPRQEKTLAATLYKQRIIFAAAMDAIASEGNRAVMVDESLMFTDPKILGFGTNLGMMHYYGRSSGLSMLTLTQRPAWIPKVIYSSITHAYIARTRDAADLKRLSDLGGIDAKETGYHVSTLPTRHDYVYVNPQGDAVPSIVNVRK